MVTVPDDLRTMQMPQGYIIPVLPDRLIANDNVFLFAQTEEILTVSAARCHVRGQDTRFGGIHFRP